MPPFHRFAGALAFGALAAGPASALDIKIEVTNLLTVPGFALTPVYFGLHDGSFDPFDVNSAASAELAELGDFSGIQGQRVAGQPTSRGAVVASPSGPPPLEPGESASATQTVDPFENRALSFFSMVVPSNDTFIGNDNPLEFLLFDGAGNYNGDFDIIITTDYIYDAGSEVNDPATGLPGMNGGAAFLQDAVGTEGADEGGDVTQLTEVTLQALFDDFVGLTTAPGTVVQAPTVTTGFELARISVRAVPESVVPVPAAAPLLAGAIAVFGIVRTRRKG